MSEPEKSGSQFDYAGPDVRARARWWLPRWLLLGALLGSALVAGVAYFAADVAPRGPESTRAQCSNKLRQIGLACLMYANANSDQYPENLGIVLRDEDIDPIAFICPNTTDTPARGPTTQATIANLTAGGHLSYIYMGKGMTSAAPADAVLAYEPLTNHGGEGMNVLYNDGRVSFQDAATSGQIIAELQAGHNPPRPEKLK